VVARGGLRPPGQPRIICLMSATDPWWALLLSVVFGAPWIVAIAWLWSKRPRDGAVPPSLAETARKRLWTN
jgi:hypothetical protein